MTTISNPLDYDATYAHVHDQVHINGAPTISKVLFRPFINQPAQIAQIINVHYLHYYIKTDAESYALSATTT